MNSFAVTYFKALDHTVDQRLFGLWRGNLALAGDFSLDYTADRMWLIKNGGTWFEVNRSSNG
jgi:hypothetical protein